MAGKFGALRALLAAAEKPWAAARDIGQAFVEKGPLSYFERFREPAENIDDAARKYGVEFTPIGPGEIAARLPADDVSYYASSLTPKGFQTLSRGDAPSLGRVIRDLGGADMYQIDALSSLAGGGSGGRLYPAILDALSGGMGRLNVPVELTRINEMRRNLNSADALIRNPKLADTMLPIDSQLDLIRMTPEDYMQMARPEKVGALTLAHAAKAMKMLDDIERLSPQYMDAAAYQRALRQAEWLTPMSGRQQFADPGLSILSEKGIGPSTLKRLSIVDALLGGKKTNPDLWTGLGKAEGGSVHAP